MATLADKIRKHPAIAWVLTVIPVIGVTATTTNWVIQRQNEDWRRIADSKDAVIQKLQAEILEIRTSPSNSLAGIHVQAQGDGSPAIGSVGRDVVINAAPKPKDGHFINNPQFGATTLKKQPNLKQMQQEDFYCTLEKGTPIEILEKKTDPDIWSVTWNRVKVLDGPHKDKVGWVSTTNIEKK